MKTQQQWAFILQSVHSANDTPPSVASCVVPAKHLRIHQLAVQIVGIEIM